METRTGGGYMQGGGTRTGGESVMEVDSDWHDGGVYVVVYMDSDWQWTCDGGIWQQR